MGQEPEAAHETKLKGNSFRLPNECVGVSFTRVTSSFRLIQ